MLSAFENPDHILATAVEMLVAEEMYETADILRTADIAFEQTGYDNWNGGTDIYTLYVRVAAAEFIRLKPRKESIEKQIQERLQPIVTQLSDDWFSVLLAPKLVKHRHWRRVASGITKTIRQNIFDGLQIEATNWAGNLGHAEFLERIFDLSKLSSFDSRFDDAAGDIWQHTVNNPEDWDDNWVFSDTRFNLAGIPDDQFVRFLCEIVHPVVRPDRDECLRLVSHFNDQLKAAGWAIVEEELIAGRPRFVGQKIGLSGERTQARARTVADALDAGWMQKEIQRLESAAERDPSLAIGTAKDLVESCCKTILTKCGSPPSRSDNLPKLTKSLMKELSLVPDGIPDQARGAKTIKMLLSNLTTLTQGLAELRGLYGSGHGRDGKHRGLEPRHARLAVASAVAFIDFVTETFHRRQLKQSDSRSSSNIQEPDR